MTGATTLQPTNTPATLYHRRSGVTYRITWGGVWRSEWIKLWSLRSTWISVIVALVAMIGFGLTMAAEYKGLISSDSTGGSTDAVALCLTGAPLAQLVACVLGVLMSAGEYSTGSIRTTLAAVPRRYPVLVIKMLICGTVSFVVGWIGALGSFLITGVFISGTRLALSLTTPGVLLALTASALFMAFVAMMAVALGFLLRSVAGGTATLVALLFMVPGLLSFLPSSLNKAISPYLPSNAGASMYALHQVSGTLSAGVGTCVVLVWTVVIAALGLWQLMRSDN